MPGVQASIILRKLSTGMEGHSSSCREGKEKTAWVDQEQVLYVSGRAYYLFCIEALWMSSKMAGKN